MAPEFLGKLSGLLLGAGYGILAVVCLAATIIFGKWCSSINEDSGKYEWRDPQDYSLDEYQTALTITIFACITFAVGFAAIALSGILGGNKIVLILLAGIVAVCGIVTLICEGLFYNFALLESKNVQYGKGYRNVSSAQSYIKDAVEACYKQAYSNFEEVAKVNPAIVMNNILKWDDVQKKIGTDISDGGKDYFTYRNFFQSLLPGVIILSIGDDFDYPIPFSQTGIDYEDRLYFVIATFNEVQVPVASLNFKDTEKFTKTTKIKACWAKDSDKESYKCTTLENEEKDLVSDGVRFNYSPFALTQYIVPDDTYFSNIQIEKDEISINYLVSGIPIAYKLLDYNTAKTQVEKYNDEKTEEVKTAFFFEEDDDHYKVSGKSYAQSLRSDEKKTEGPSDDEFYWCQSEPSSYEKAVEECDLKTNYLLNDEKELPNAFAFTNVGKFPGFYNDYAVSKKRDSIFVYLSGDTRLYQFAFAAMLITLFGVLFVVGGLVPSLMGGSD